MNKHIHESTDHSSRNRAPRRGLVVLGTGVIAAASLIAGTTIMSKDAPRNTQKTEQAPANAELYQLHEHLLDEKGQPKSKVNIYFGPIRQEDQPLVTYATDDNITLEAATLRYVTELYAMKTRTEKDDPKIQDAAFSCAAAVLPYVMEVNGTENPLAEYDEGSVILMPADYSAQIQ